MNSINVKKGDNVLVIAGKDNGKVAKVIASNPKTNRVVVEGVNIVTKCKKARSAQEKSSIIKQEAPISASNVMVVCPSCSKATRVAHAEVDGKKVRVCKKCGASLEVSKAKKADKKVATKTTAKKETAKKAETAEKKPAEKKTTTKKSTAKKTAEKKD